MRIRLARGVIIGVVLAIFGYFFLIPPFWPEPIAELSFPRSARFDQDATVSMIVSSSHANVEVATVYLVVECENYQELNLSAALYPVSLYQPESVKQHWQSPNRFTWPRHTRYEYTIPLRELAQQGIARPGILEGQAHISLGYPHMNARRRMYGRRNNTYFREQSIPFSITLTGDTP